MKNSRSKILGIGAAIIDHIIDITDEYLEKIPGAKGGMLTVDYQTLQGILSDHGNSHTISVGGSAANVIRGLANLGDVVAFVGKVGKDAEGKKFVREMQGNGVELFMASVDVPTSQVACLVTPDKERTMRAYLGASKKLSEVDIVSEIFKDVELLHLEGYIVLNRPLAIRVMELAKKAKVKISYDLGSFEVVAENKEFILSILDEYVDIVFGNTEEVKCLTNCEYEEGCLFLQKLCDVAVLLMGAEGCVVSGEGQKIYVPANKVHVVDTTGAGDFFASGFLHKFLQKKSLDECARFGVLLGGEVVQVHGVHLSSDRWQELKK